MKFNITPEEYQQIVATKRSHQRFINKMSELGFDVNENDIKEQAIKELLSDKEIQKALKKIGDD